MQKSAPSLARVLTMVVFALSCFGLLLFLWLSFGGPIPLKPQGYRVQVGFPEATTLAKEADVRIAGVSVGRVRELQPDGADVLEVLHSQEAALQRLVKNTGVTFAALTENEQQLQSLITSSKRVFDTTASRNDALAESIRIFPTFLDESKATFARLQTFSNDTRPLVQDLRPVARELRPTLADVRALAPDLERFFRDLDPLIDASKEGLPAAREVLRGAQPLLDQIHPFLGQLNPMLQFLELSQL